MHLKFYFGDRRLRRAGYANLSCSGKGSHEDGIVLLVDPGAAWAFEHEFETHARPDNQRLRR